MNGYLIKDYRLFMAQKNLLIILPIGFLFMFTNESPVMGISYTLYVITFLSNSLMSYDSFDNGMAFLMTLPGGRKNYVNEKYLFNIINSTLTALLLIFIASALELSRGNGSRAVKELILGTLILYAVALIFSAVMLPIQIKFGQEKSRIVMLILFGTVFLGSMAIGKIVNLLNIDTNALLEQLNQFSGTGMAIGFFLFMLLIVTISWGISQNIMKKKSF